MDKSTITVDAILTNRGRELLAQGGVGSSQQFSITKFALADDEVDYALYNTSHPQGSEYYGNIIENMPILEASPDEQLSMRYKLVSLGALGATFITPSGEINIPSIDDAADAVMAAGNSFARRNFTTTNPVYNESHTLLVANARLFTITNETTGGTVLNSAENINANGSITIQIPYNNVIVFTRIDGKSGVTTATVFGDETGAVATFSITTS